VTQRFRNASSAAVEFTLRGVSYSAKPGEEVTPEIPHGLAYAVKARGLPLELLPATAGEVVADESLGLPSDPEARLWYERAHDSRRMFHQAAEECENLRAERARIAEDSAKALATLRAEHETALTSMRVSHAAELAGLKAQHEAELAQLTEPRDAEATQPPDTSPSESPKGRRTR